MPIPDVQIDDEFVLLVADELDIAEDEFGTVDPADICEAVIKIARLRSGENY